MPYAIRYRPPLPDQEPAGQAEPAETMYVTISRHDPQRHISWPNMGNAMMACVAIALLLTLVVSPDVYTTRTLVVPAILLPVQTTTLSVPITPTGVKQYPAAQAHGLLTITNGGSLAQYIQAGFLLSSTSSVEVATDQSVAVPAGDGEHYGVATVEAHAVAAGRSGNIPAYGVMRTYGTDIFLKNLSAFNGGQDAYAVRYVTAADKHTALVSATTQAEARQPLVLVLKPCAETTSVGDTQATATLVCQPVTYHAPAEIHILSVRMKGTSVVLTYRALVVGGS